MAHSSRLSLLGTALLLVALAIHMPDRTTADVVMLPNEALYVDVGLILPPYQFVIQTDCNLVLYNSETPLWASNTTLEKGPRNCMFLLQSDGNGVVYESGVNALYATDTWGRNDGDHIITLRSDGNVVMTNARGDTIWQTGTAGQ